VKIIDYSEKKLSVKLLNGRHCTYFDVPEAVYDELISSSSPLEYFNKNIWGSKYEHSMGWESLDALLNEIAEILLIDPPISVNEKRFEDTPIHVVSVWGDINALKMLIDAGAKVNVFGDLSCTPLYNTVSFGHVRCTKMLIEAGATLDDVNELNTSAQKRALKSKNPELAKLFIQHT
jgi:hypothetical protein